MNVYDRLKELNLSLPTPPARGGAYSPAVETRDHQVYISGCGPKIDREITGRVGREVDLETGRDCARDCMLNVLAVLERHIGDLNRVSRAVKVLCFVNSDDSFFRQPEIANGATGLLADLFGEEKGLPARSAIGVNALPGNIPVEVEAIFEIAPEEQAQ